MKNDELSKAINSLEVKVEDMYDLYLALLKIPPAHKNDIHDLTLKVTDILNVF